MKLPWQKWLFETFYKNRYLYRLCQYSPLCRTMAYLATPCLIRSARVVLELGWGLGDLLADMIEAGYNCRAVEHSTEMVDAARSTFMERCQGEATWVIQGQSQQLPFTDASFDNVVSTFPSEYICDPNTLAEVERVLNPGGRLIALVGAKPLPINPIQSFLLFLIQVFIYGPAVFFKSGREIHRKFETSTGITTEVIPNAEFGKSIPLEQYGLSRRCERVCSSQWEVYIVTGEKLDVH